MSQTFRFEKSSVSAKYRRRKRSAWPVAVLLLFVVGGAGAAGYWLLMHKAIQLPPLAQQKIAELAKFELLIAPTAKNVRPDELSFRLEGAPAGAKLDADSGQFAWTPDESQGPGDYVMQVHVEVAGRPDLAARIPLSIHVDEANQPPILEAVADQVLKGSKVLTLQLAARDDDVPPQPLKFGFLPGAPKGVVLDEKTGKLTWTPKTVPAGADLPITVVVTDSLKKQAKQTFKLRFESTPSAFENLTAFLDDQKLAHKLLGRAPQPIFGGTSRILDIDGQRIMSFEFEDADQADQDVRRNFQEDSGKLARMQLFQRDSLVVLYAGTDARLAGALRQHLGNSLTPGAAPATTLPISSPSTSAAPVTPATPTKPAAAPLVAAVQELYEKKKLLAPKEYLTLRKLFADEFAASQRDTIQVALGADYDGMMAWFDKHIDVKEEFFTAIQPQHDQVANCFSLFNDLRKAYPKQFDNYGNLAIALAVTWDKPNGVYNYAGHQSRTKSSMPAALAEAADNFQYLVETEPVMQGRIRYMPWEFLTHIVNHPTPIDERQWALQKYLNRRAMFGSAYGEVPYDHEMLRTSSAVCKLANQPYTLPNILQYGGVCAMQADFAARVGKSLGVPAAYVAGESQSGDRHAWVMWVELKNVTPTSIVFSLESFGRYNLDKYYVGTLADPQTGERTTDRELELALQNVGANPIARRHASLVMRAYPRLRDAAELNVDQQLQLLSDVIRYVPGNEAAWTEVARVAKAGKIEKPQQKQMLTALDNLFRTFAAFPDFTWKVFDDLISFHDDAKQRIAYYERLVQLYLQAERPDLACEAMLKLASLLAADDRKQVAVEGLAAAIMKFPGEGRYVPKMLDQLEANCQQFKDADQHLIRFYQGFLPKVPQTRGSEPSKYCMNVYARGATLFRRLGRDDLAQTYEVELAKLNAKK